MGILVASLLAGAVLGASASASREPFEASIVRLNRETRALMVGSSWHPGCPVPLRNLRLVRLTYWGFDDAPHRGRLVVHRGWADEMIAVFRRLYERRFPVRRMRLVDRYGADDRASMRHDNTSAFNCRFVAGTTTWSQHAYGRAIDVNPVENPFVVGSRVSPRRGRRFLDRSDVRPGISSGVGRLCAPSGGIGWGWGGSWVSVKDYQHLSANGR